jgi:hypothetical protein
LLLFLFSSLTEVLIYFEEKKSSKGSKNLVMDDQRLEPLIVKGQRGRNLLSWDGFLFAQNNKTADSIYW